MAYVSPSTRTTGDLITSAIWNQDIVSNSQASVPDIFTTAGDTAYATAADTAARLAIGSAYQHYGVNSTATAPEWQNAVLVLDNVTADTTFASSTAENTYYTYAVAGGILSTNRFLRLKTYWSLLNNSGGNDTFTYKVKYGSATLFTLSITMNTGATRHWLWIELTLKGDTATNAQRSDIFYGSTTLAGAVSIGSDEVTSAQDSTSSQNLVQTMQFGANNAQTTATVRHSTLEFIPAV